MPSSDEKEQLCGLGNFRPTFLQKFASKKPYVIIYGFLGIFQSMQSTYISSMVSTFEKRFGITSKESALLMSGNEITQILFLFVLPFVIKIKKRTLWLALSLFCTGVGLITIGLPYLITEHKYVDLYPKDSDSSYSNTPKKTETNIGLNITSFSNATNEHIGVGMCGSEDHPSSLEKSCERGIDYVGLSLIFIGIFLTGIGNCFYYTFGLTYLDDNMSHGSSPIWLALTFVFKLIGPTLGFLLAGACLKTYDDPSKDPGFDETDPRWIGAWWLGPPIIGLLIILFSLPLTLFPQRLPKTNTDSSREKQKSEKENVVPNKDGFKEAMMRLLRNKLFMYNFVSNYFYIFAFKGFGTFMQKFMEYQFRKSASGSANFGGGSAFISAIGLLTSGLILSKFKLSARLITGWNVVIMGLICGWLVMFGSIGCPTSDVYGEKTGSGINITGSCNSHCDCPVSRPQPICSQDGVTNFYSPCVAGCTGPIKTRYDQVKKKNLTIYSNCGCAVDAWEHNWEDILLESPNKKWSVEEYIHRDEAVKGWCEVDCSSVWTLFMVSALLVGVVASTGRIGNILVAFRCVEVQDKSLSIAFNVTLLSLFAMLPSPIIYGKIIDGACILWQNTCGGETGNCLTYDTVQLRTRFMFTTAAIMSFGVIADIAVCYEAKNLVIFREEEQENSISDKNANESNQLLHENEKQEN